MHPAVFMRNLHDLGGCHRALPCNQRVVIEPPCCAFYLHVWQSLLQVNFCSMFRNILLPCYQRSVFYFFLLESQEIKRPLVFLAGQTFTSLHDVSTVNIRQNCAQTRTLIILLWQNSPLLLAQ